MPFALKSVYINLIVLTRVEPDSDFWLSGNRPDCWYYENQISCIVSGRIVLFHREKNRWKISREKTKGKFSYFADLKRINFIIRKKRTFRPESGKIGYLVSG